MRRSVISQAHDVLRTITARGASRAPGPMEARRALDSELREMDEAYLHGDVEAFETELGDVMFCLVLLGDRTGVDPEAALSAAAERLLRRFELACQIAGRRSFGPGDRALFDAAWEEAKRCEAVE